MSLPTEVTLLQGFVEANLKDLGVLKPCCDNDDCPNSKPVVTPIVEDVLLVVALRDLDSGSATTHVITTAPTTSYRTLGMVERARRQIG